MIMVFWLECGQVNAKSFNDDDITAPLKFAEQLRVLRKTGDDISHVCIQSESPNSVGEAGVASPAADYAWYKRRNDPAIPVGRDPWGM